MPSAVDRLATNLRDHLNDAVAGDVQRWVMLDEIRQRAGLHDHAACQSAALRAADMGWIATAGGREVHSVRMTPEGCRVARRPRAR